MDCSPPGSSVHGISQASILEWVAISSSKGSYQPSDWTHISCKSPTLRPILYCWAKVLSVDSYNLNKQKLNTIMLGGNKEEEKKEKEGGGGERQVDGSKGWKNLEFQAKSFCSLL